MLHYIAELSTYEKYSLFLNVMCNPVLFPISENICVVIFYLNYLKYSYYNLWNNEYEKYYHLRNIMCFLA